MKSPNNKNQIRISNPESFRDRNKSKYRKIQIQNKTKFEHSGLEFRYCPDKSGLISDFGFILLEVLVSILILSIGLVAVLGAFSSSTKIIANTKRYSEAVQLAERKMFEFQTTPMENWQTRDSGDFGDQYPEYSWEIEIQEKDSEFPDFDSEITLEPQKYYQITLRIKYEEQGRISVPIELVTYMTTQRAYLE